MKKFLSIAVVWVCLCLSWTSCEKDVLLEMPDMQPVLVMNALINADSVNNYIYLSKTGVKQPEKVEDAWIEIRVNGELKEVASSCVPGSGEQGDGLIGIYRVTTRFRPGDVVRIDAHADGEDMHVWAEDRIPYPIEAIEKVDTAFVQIYWSGNSYADQMRYDITFKDRPGERNYYRLVLENHIAWKKYNSYLEEMEEVSEVRYDMVTREDVVLTDGHPFTGEDEDNGMISFVENKYSVFDDSRFTDRAYTMRVYNTAIDHHYIGDGVKYLKMKEVIRILSITEAEFRYLQALNYYDSDAYDEMIGEPLKFPSNVHGGTGIVGFSSETNYVLPVYDRKYED